MLDVERGAVNPVGQSREDKERAEREGLQWHGSEPLREVEEGVEGDLGPVFQGVGRVDGRVELVPRRDELQRRSSQHDRWIER